MKAKQLAQWLTDLRSGDYEQCKKVLHIKDDGYCCLGVLARCAGYSKTKIIGTSLYPNSYASDLDCNNMLGLTKNEETKLIQMNDGEDLWEHNSQSFDQIADWIDANITPDPED